MLWLKLSSENVLKGCSMKQKCDTTPLKTTGTFCFIKFVFQANYSADLKAEKTIIDRHYNRASLCTVMSIIFGIIIIVIIGVMLWKDPEKLDNPILLRLLRLYRPWKVQKTSFPAFHKWDTGKQRRPISSMYCIKIKVSVKTNDNKMNRHTLNYKWTHPIKTLRYVWVVWLSPAGLRWFHRVLISVFPSCTAENYAGYLHLKTVDQNASSEAELLDRTKLNPNFAAPILSFKIFGLLKPS